MKNRGEITVFLSLCLLCTFALLCMLAESARMAGSRYYFQTAANGAMDNLFSQYDRLLWQRYRILGLPYETSADLSERLQSYMNKYLEVDNWYPMELETVEITDCESLADQGGDHLAQEVVDYMKFGIWNSLLISPENGAQFMADIREASSAGMMADTYREQAEAVSGLEQVVERIADCVKSQDMLAGRIADRLADDDAHSFHNNAEFFRSEARRMSGLKEDYERQAELLREKMAETEEKLREAQEDMQADRQQLFAEQMTPYRSYIDEDGERRQEIMAQMETSEANLQLLERTEAAVEEAEERETDAGEADAGADAGEAAESGEEESRTPSLAEAAAMWTGYRYSSMDLEERQADEERRGYIDQAADMAQSGLLRLVLPADMPVSSAGLPTAEFPSRRSSGRSRVTRNPVERVLIHEYCTSFFVNAMSPEEKPVQYEIEYLLFGKNTDRKNLEETVSKLLLIRQGMNLIQILSDADKREAARSLAMAIVGIFGLAPLVEITAFVIMGAWAAGESVMDLRTLFAGGKIPLWKNAGEWQLSLDGLLAMGASRACPDAENCRNGLAYEDYLKLLLFLTGQKDLQMRMLDLMQMNVQREEESFSITDCAYQVDICGKACGKPVFSRLSFVENFVGWLDDYRLEAPAQRAY